MRRATQKRNNSMPHTQAQTRVCAFLSVCLRALVVGCGITTGLRDTRYAPKICQSTDSTMVGSSYYWLPPFSLEAPCMLGHMCGTIPEDYWRHVLMHTTAASHVQIWNSSLRVRMRAAQDGQLTRGSSAKCAQLQIASQSVGRIVAPSCAPPRTTIAQTMREAASSADLTCLHKLLSRAHGATSSGGGGGAKTELHRGDNKLPSPSTLPVPFAPRRNEPRRFPFRATHTEIRAKSATHSATMPRAEVQGRSTSTQSPRQQAPRMPT